MKKFRILLLLFLSVTFISCGDQNKQGYEDGLKGEKNGFLHAINRSYQSGYEEATQDQWLFEAGCGDAEAGNAPKRPEPEYQAGYRKCKRKVSTTA